MYFWHICIWVGTLHPLLWIISKTWLIVVMFANAEYNAIYIYVGQSKIWNSRCKYDSTLSSMHLGCYICNIHLHLRWHIFVIEYINTNTNESKYAFCHNGKYKKYKYMKWNIHSVISASEWGGIYEAADAEHSVAKIIQIQIQI